MASSYTGLGTELMTTGENAGNWGTKTNVNLQIIEQISGGYTEQDIAGSADTTTLAVSDGSAGAVLAHRIIKFTGTITGNQIVTIPLDVQQMYVLVNGTSGAYTVQFKYASGSGSSVTFAATDKGTKLVYATADHATNPNLVDTGIASTGDHDLDGNELILDADADTSITADTDDQIDIKIAGADDFQFTANTFTAQAGSTIAAQALTATTVTASGIVKTDDTTEATSTTDGSLQTDGGLSIAKDAVFGDDVKLLSDSAVLSFGADSDTTLTHTDGTGLTLNSTNKLTFQDTGTYVGSNADGDLDVVSDGTAVDSINIESAGGITLDAGTAGSGVVYEDDGTEMARLYNSSSDVILETKVSDKDFSIKGNDGGSAITALSLDMSAAGAATFNDKVIATELDISGNMDIDGTSNLDAVDIDGAVQVDAAITVGVDDTGYDVKFFGATSGAYMLWDESTDDLILAGAAKLYLYDAGGGEYLSSSGSALTIASGGTAWELPTSDGSANQLLKTDGSGNLDWTTVSGTITALNTQAANRLTTIGSTTTELDGEANLTFTGSALTCIGTITVGVDDTGHDVKFFGATAGSYALWDESADSLLLTDSTPLKIGDSQDLTLYHDGTNSYITNSQGALKVATETSGIAVTIGHTTSETTIADNATITGNLSVGGNFDVTGTLDFSDSAITNAGDIQLDSITGDGDTDTAITFSGSNVITVKANNADQVTFTDGAIVPSSDNDIDLGTSSVEFKDAFFDGTVTADAFAGPLTGDVTGNVSGTAATVTTAAQSNITSLGTLTTLTVDNVIINGTTIGHTSDTDLLTLTDGVLTVAGEVSATTLDIGGTNIGSTAAELNLLDGSAKSTSSITLADSDALIVIDGTTTKQIPVSDIKTYNPGGTAWQAVVTGNTTMVSGRGYFVNTTSAAITMTLPASPSLGDSVTVIDYAGTADSNNITIGRNSQKIHSASEDMTVATERAAFTLVFTDSTQGWLLTEK